MRLPGNSCRSVAALRALLSLWHCPRLNTKVVIRLRLCVVVGLRVWVCPPPSHRSPLRANPSGPHLSGSLDVCVGGQAGSEAVKWVLQVDLGFLVGWLSS